MSNPYELEENARKIRSLIKNTSARDWEILPLSTTSFQGMEQLREFINALDEKIALHERSAEGLPPRVVVDHSFNVKGIGSVVLGRVARGTIHRHDKLTIHPIDRKVEIRNIQMHDENKDSAGPGTRVGLALKGVQAKEVERGHIISDKEITSTEVELECSVSEFSPGLSVNSTQHLYIGLQSGPVTITGITVDAEEVDKAPPGSVCRLTLKAGWPFAFNGSDVFILAELNSPQQRFIARGVV